ncbi:mucin-binding protein [Lactobacillus kitasatonis]|uniref:mucin-binding protein n=1 Tax=Lactobacillus kitasatonis TaxID=237446 RepID=UPI00046910E0|nr:LPXTG cell wall anchor domain-containing protein [Lactobacillus kitasatonis]
MEGYNSPVIPAISVSISDFLNNDITDPTYDDYLYDGHHPIQRQSLEVVPLPDDTKYDVDYEKFSKVFDEEYKDNYDLSDNDFEALLIKEEYFYTKPIEGKEEKTITRTINVHLPNGEVQTTTQPVTLERTYTSVAGSDEKTYSDWTKGLWEAFTVPELAGYTALSISVDAVEVTSESLDAVVDIYYRTDDPAIVSGKEEKTITRTINVHLPSGEVQTTKQPVTLERTYTSVVGSYTKKYGPWTTGIWEAFTAPELDGYTALPTSVDAVEVTSESLDAVVDIYYRADVPVLPATPVDPTDPSTPTTPVDPTDPSTSTTPVTPTDPSTSTTPVHPTDPPTPTINVKNNISNELASGSKVEDEVDATTDSQEKLPQTGNKSSVIYSIFGLILTSLLGVWAFVRKH